MPDSTQNKRGLNFPTFALQLRGEKKNVSLLEIKSGIFAWEKDIFSVQYYDPSVCLLAVNVQI